MGWGWGKYPHTPSHATTEKRILFSLILGKLKKKICVCLIPALTNFSRFWNVVVIFLFCLTTLFLKWFWWKYKWLEVLGISFVSTLHTLKLGIEQGGNNKNNKNFSALKICQQGLWNFNSINKWIVKLLKLTNNKDLPHQILRKSGRETFYLFYLAIISWYNLGKSLGFFYLKIENQLETMYNLQNTSYTNWSVYFSVA